MCKSYDFDNYADFSKSVVEVFADSEFIRNIPDKAESYKIIMFESVAKFNKYLEDYVSSDKSYIYLSGSDGLYTSKAEPVVLLLPDTVEPLTDIIIGGCF